MSSCFYSAPILANAAKTVQCFMPDAALRARAAAIWYNVRMKTKFLLVGLMASALSAGCFADAVVYVDGLDLSGMSAGRGKRPAPRKSVSGGELRLGAGRYERGFGTCPESAVAFSLGGKAIAFDAVVGIDANAAAEKTSGRPAGAIFRVWADGKIVLDTGTIRERDKPRAIHADLRGVDEVVLETASYAPWCGFECSNADWAEAKFTVADGASVTPVAPSRFAQLGILTPPEPAAPQFNGAEVWGVRPGRPVIFRVPVSGVRPMEFSAAGLPAGVTLDAKGVLRGTAPAKAGDYPISVTAKNAAGSATRVVTLRVGDTICLTPPMGWNSWNIWGWSLTAEYAKRAARALDASGLGDYGYAYVNLDDWWQRNNSDCPRSKERSDVKGPARDTNGKILPNGGFPDMKEVADYIHSFGFKAGLYSSPGPLTCGQCEGSYGHEKQDAESYAEWGFDYLKYDWCSYGDIFKKETGWDTWEWMGGGRVGRNPKNKPLPPRSAFEKPYRLMNEHLRAQNRDIVYAYCQYGCGDTQLWGRDAGANVWRSWQDLKDTWTWMRIAIEGYVPNAEFHKYTGPGFWADPDMMIVGQQRSFGTTHPTFLTPNEQYTHVSLWSLLAAPLLIGTDLERLDPFTKSILANRELIAISQDVLGRQARRVHREDAFEIWARPLANGDVAVGLMNCYPLSRRIALDLQSVCGPGARVVRDAWRQKDLGTFSGLYAAEVPGHATQVLRIRPAAK